MALYLYFRSKIIKNSAIPHAKEVANSYWLESGILPAPIPLVTNAAVCNKNAPFNTVEANFPYFSFCANNVIKYNTIDTRYKATVIVNSISSIFSKLLFIEI